MKVQDVDAIGRNAQHEDSVRFDEVRSLELRDGRAEEVAQGREQSGKTPRLVDGQIAAIAVTRPHARDEERSGLRRIPGPRGGELGGTSLTPSVLDLSD